MKIKEIVGQISVLVLCVLSSAVILVGSGALEQISGSGSQEQWIKIVSFALFILLSFRFKYIFLFIVFPCVLLMGLYFPIGFNFGLPNAGQIVSAFNTDTLEAKEFLGKIPLWQYVVPFVTVPTIAFCYWVTKKIQRFEENPVSHIIVLILCFAIAVLAGDFRSLRQGYRYSKEVLTGLSELKNVNSITPNWEIVSSNPKYKNYVFVIGESNRKDYMHAYGYPVENTPFMESKGYLLDGMKSVSDYTIPSLNKMLTKTTPRVKVNYEKKLIDLVNMAGFESYWLSNQGHINKKDTPITALAGKALHKHWLKAGDNALINSSDLDLLPLVKSALAQSIEKPRFIVLHLMGSHSDVCERIHAPFEVPVSKNSYYQDVYCYNISMKQTDYFLSQLDEMLNKSGESYSILYLPDHGVTHNDSKDRLVMNHGNPANHHRDIPLYKVSSDDTQLHRIIANRYANNVTEGIAHWLGIQTKDLMQPRDLFRDESDIDEEGVENLLRSRRDDPALDITAERK